MKVSLNALLQVLVIAFALHGTARAAPDPAQYRLTVEALRTLEAIDAESKQAAAGRNGEESDDAEDDNDDDDSDDDKDATVEGIARKVDANPQLKAALARKGMSGMDFALTFHAVLHAGMYLAFEDSMDKQKAAELYRSYSKAQQANIELLRKHHKQAGK